MPTLIPPKDELTYYLDEIMRDAKTQREVLTALGRLYNVNWQMPRRWMLVLSIPLPFALKPQEP